MEKVGVYVINMERYETLRLIGEGAFGKALLCIDKLTGSNVVVKYINIAAQAENVQKASLQEAKILRVVDHPNVISYIDSFIEEGKYLCIVMEYACGGDLHSLVHTPGQSHFSEEQIVQWMRELLDGLEYIHSIHIIHRDIKPKNMFLDAENHLKIGDFGIAKILENTGDMANTIVGSPFYLSPELCEGKSYDTKADIWAVGCVLYELCTLKRAFGGPNMGAVVMKIMNEKLPPIPKIYSHELSRLIDSMLNKNPRSRPTISDLRKSPLFSVSDEIDESIEEIIGKSSKKTAVKKPSKPRKKKVDPPLKVISLAPPVSEDPVVRKPKASRPVSSVGVKKKRPQQIDLKLGKCFIVKSLEREKKEELEYCIRGRRR